MNPITEQHSNIASFTAHGDDLEMHHSGALQSAINPYAIIASDGEASTLNYSGITFDDVEAYRQQRRRESEMALGHLGIAKNRRIYLELPDGELSQEPHASAMTKNLGDFVIEHSITALLTLGASGYCGHGDHIQTHSAAMDAQAQLWDAHRWMLDVYALTSTNTHPRDTKSELASVTVNQEDKEHLLGFHATQMDRTINNTGRHILSPAFRRTLLPVYGSLFHEEVYERLTINSPMNVHVAAHY